MSLYNIGPKALEAIWIKREREERQLHYPDFGRADMIQTMRREMQEACGLVLDPASAEDAFDRQIEEDAHNGTLDRIAAVLDAETDPATDGEEAK